MAELGGYLGLFLGFSLLQISGLLSYLRIQFRQIFIEKIFKQINIFQNVVVLLPENLQAHYELSLKVWTLHKAPQMNSHYPNSCPGQIKLNALRLQTEAFIAGLIQSRWIPWSKPITGF